MNIDVDNLCSFMPQDKVGSFTQQSAKGILHKTLECIKVSGDKNLHEEQMELAQEQNCTRDRGREVEMQQSAVDTLRNQLNGMKSEVERIQQRVAVEQRLKLFEIKLLVIALQECEKACKAKQELADAAMKELASKKADIQPLEGRVRALQKQQAVFEKTIKASADKKLRSDQELQAFVSTMNDCDVQ
ncbi:smc-5, partial [Symbiodinium microadriaticum]